MPTIAGHRWFIIFLVATKGNLYLHKKSGLRSMTKNQFESNIKIFWSDNGNEYIDS